MVKNDGGRTLPYEFDRGSSGAPASARCNRAFGALTCTDDNLLLQRWADLWRPARSGAPGRQ
jgi:heat shock protein HslJ